MTDTNPRDLIQRLVDIADALDGRKPLVFAQGQVMDGFTALANFQALANEARAYLDQPEPKPPSLKEQALHALGSPMMIGESRLIGHRDHDLLRRALEALPDDRP